MNRASGFSLDQPGDEMHQVPLPGWTMALHSAGSPIPGTARSLLPMLSAGTSKDQRAALPRAGKGLFSPRRAGVSEETCSNSCLGIVMVCPPPQCQGWRLPWVLFRAPCAQPPPSVL